MATVEYSKVIRVKPLSGAGTNRGFQGYVTLPAASGSIPAKTLPIDNSYINTYVAVAGYECGISAKRNSDFYDSVTGTYQWHWFVNGPETKDGPHKQFTDGAKIHLKIMKLDSGKIQFWVNGVSAFTSIGSPALNAETPARMIIGAERLRYEESQLPSTLPTWDLYHNQVTLTEMKYATSDGTWVNVTSSNTDAATDRNPSPVKYPNIVTPAPLNYTLTKDLNNATVYGSIKA